MSDSIRVETVVEETSNPDLVKLATSVEKLSEIDRLSLELAKSNKKLAMAQAEKALAQNETAEMSFKYTILQIYRKYSLTDADALNEKGEILRGGALPKTE